MQSRLDIDVSALLDGREEELVVNEKLQDEPYVLAGYTLTPEGQADVRVSLRNVGAGILAKGSVREILRTECSRCLAELDLPVTGEISELFAFAPAERDEDEEERVRHVVADRVDLYRPARDAVGLAIPLVPLCREDCRGICPECGADRNETDCGHGGPGSGM